MAATARFDLTGDRQTGSLENGRVLTGTGTIARMNWVPEADQPRGYTVSLPVTHIGWRSLAIEFTPARAGTVTLTLMGPWEEASKGVLYREEVLWDDIKAEGAKLSDGGFESHAAGRPPRWQSAGGTIVDADTRRAGRRRLALCPNLAQPDALHQARGRGRPAGDDPSSRPGRPPGRPARDEADRGPLLPGTPRRQAFPSRRQPRQQPRSAPRPGLGRPLHARGPSPHQERGLRPRADPGRLASLHRARPGVPDQARDLRAGR